MALVQKLEAEGDNLTTCATFLLLSYSKFLCVNQSICVQNCGGEVIPNSSVLLYNPSIQFLHSEHIPYASLAISIIIVCSSPSFASPTLSSQTLQEMSDL